MENQILIESLKTKITSLRTDLSIFEVALEAATRSTLSSGAADLPVRELTPFGTESDTTANGRPDYGEKPSARTIVLQELEKAGPSGARPRDLQSVITAIRPEIGPNSANSELSVLKTKGRVERIEDGAYRLVSQPNGMGMPAMKKRSPVHHGPAMTKRSASPETLKKRRAARRATAAAKRLEAVVG